MTALVVLIPGLLIGAIAWGAVGILRQRGREPFTLTTALAFYAELMVIAGILAALAGAGTVVKLLLSTIQVGYAYAIPSFAGYMGPSVQQQQQQDVIMAAMLVAIGLLVAGGHTLLRRVVRALPSGSPSWIGGGGLVAVTVLSGLAGFLCAIIGGYEVLVYFIVGSSSTTPFGDAAGSALTFIPAWAVAMSLLLHRVRQAPAPGGIQPA